jgi:hypothetical protein
MSGFNVPLEDDRGSLFLDPTSSRLKSKDNF